MTTLPLNQESKPLLTIAEMANELHVPRKTIYYWVGRFEIPFMKVGRHIRFNRDEVLQFFHNRTPARASCLAKRELVEPRTLNGRVSSHRSLKIRNGNLAET